MKTKILLAISAIISITSSGQGIYDHNYFEDGTRWITEVHGGPPFMVHRMEVTEISGETVIDGVPALNMYRSFLDGTNQEPPLYIRTEGDKVYFLDPELYVDNDKWHLAYDFGLKPGEGCDIYSLSSRHIGGKKPYALYIQCVATTWNDLLFWGRELMIVECYTNREEMEQGGSAGFDGPLDCGQWIMGIGSINGVLDNNMFNGVGSAHALIEVTNNGKTLYSNGTLGIADAAADAPTMSVQGNELTVSGAAGAVSVYNCAGNLVRTIAPGGPDATVTLPAKGIYIVRAGEITRKFTVN